MSTTHTRGIAKAMLTPSVVLLFIWMIVPLVMTLYFSFQNYNLLIPDRSGWVGFLNYEYFFTDPSFLPALTNTLLLVGGVLAITIIGGIGMALLMDQEIFGQGIARIFMISPFFVMPTVAALVWKNMLMNPVNGLFAHLAHFLGFQSVDFFSTIPLLSIIIIVAWQWLPFATLILLTSLQSLDSDQKEAATLDGAGVFQQFRYITLPHLGRAIGVVVLIETIFLLSIFAEILVTTNGGPGSASTNLTYMVFAQALLQFDVGSGSAGAIIAVILANIVAFFLIRSLGKTIEA